MEINTELIKKLKKLSNIELSPSEEERIKKDLNALLEYQKILDKIDVDGVEEMISPVEFSTSILRKDLVESFEHRKEIINNFPENKDGFLAVPGIHINEEE
jgi:aspartyl-tRNA(Asn)/glutamyl-tRNA(Gln) amidotransferase subunit C